MALLIGERYRPKLENALINHGFCVFWMPDNAALDPRLASHADLSALRLDSARDGKTVILSGSVQWSGKLVSYLINKHYSIKIAASAQASAYPGDASLCACAVGKHLIHNKRVSDAAVLREWCGEYINVRQGYAKCSVCTVGKSSIITSDSGIASAAEKAGISVLQICPGHILLDGFDYGFIGGASFWCGSTVYFTGSLDAHPDGSRISDFVSSCGKTAVSLTNDRLFDIGSVVVL